MRNVTATQRLLLGLSGFRNIGVALSQSKLRLSRYYFPADRDTNTFKHDFDPSQDCKRIFSVACEICQDMLLELGNAQVSENEIRGMLKSLVIGDTDLRTEYTLTSGEKIPRIDLRALFE